MSYPTKAHAEREGKRVLALMKTKGWKVYVWDNLGWHCRLRCGHLSVNFSPTDRLYTAGLSTAVEGVGTPAVWYGKTDHIDPNESVKMAIGYLKGFVDHCQAILASCEKVISPRNRADGTKVWHGSTNHGPGRQKPMIVRASSKAEAIRLIQKTSTYISTHSFNQHWSDTCPDDMLAAAYEIGVWVDQSGLAYPGPEGRKWERIV